MSIPEITPTPAEKIAEDTWDRLKQSWDLNVRLGEETLTDLLALDFTRLTPGHSKLFQTTKGDESKRGTDLEIRIHTGGNRAVLFAVQAKKLYKTRRYDALTQGKSSDRSQIKILKEYSDTVGAKPLYLLYNHVCQKEAQQCWNCCKKFHETSQLKQLGCTLVPIRNIRQAISNRGHRKFKPIHKSSDALPWRCLFHCPWRFDPKDPYTGSGILSMLHDSLQQPEQPGGIPDCNWIRFEPVDRAWPYWLWERDDATLSTGDWEELRPYSEQKPETFPKRLLLVREK